MHGGELSGMNGMSNGDGMMQSEVESRKLVILGLPWDTTEASLEQHFSQFGPLQVIMSVASVSSQHVCLSVLPLYSPWQEDKFIIMVPPGCRKW